MTLLALAIAAALAGLLAHAIVRERREARRWRHERERIARYHERAAAANGRPLSTAVTQRATRRP